MAAYSNMSYAKSFYKKQALYKEIKQRLSVLDKMQS